MKIILIGLTALTTLALHSSVFHEECHSSASDYVLVEITDFLERAARLDWSATGEWIAYDKRGADGYHDVYRIRPDGTGNECLTCDHPSLPNKSTGNPAYHPGGRFLLFQSEMAEHPETSLTTPGKGVYNDLYVMDLKSTEPYQVHKMTNVHSGNPPGGSLHPHFSRRGDRILWGDLEGAGGCYGDWRIVVADFDESNPGFSNFEYYEPGESTEWYETQDWTLDDAGIYFSYAPLEAQDDRTMDFGCMILETGETTRLTETSGFFGEPDEWDEHGKISPLGDAVTWMTTTGYEINYDNCRHVEWLNTDLWIMNTDGSDKRKLTHYNDPGYPEFTAGGVCVSDHSWSPDGSILAVEIFYRGLMRVDIELFHFQHLSPTPTPGAHPFGVRIEMPVEAHPGELFQVTGFLDNPGAPVMNLPVFFVLDVYGRYYFWDSWTCFHPPEYDEFDYKTMTIPTGTTTITVIEPFLWPDTGEESMSGLFFYGAMLNQELSEISGEMAIVEWRYGPGR